MYRNTVKKYRNISQYVFPYRDTPSSQLQIFLEPQFRPNTDDEKFWYLLKTYT